MRQFPTTVVVSLVSIFFSGQGWSDDQALTNATAKAQAILDATGVQGGLIVDLGCGDGKLATALAGERFRVHGLATDPADVAAARAHVRAEGLYGRVAIDTFDGEHLPYIDNLINLVVAEELGNVPPQEIERVLAPNGVAYIRRDGQWTTTVKPRPAAIDEWTHFLYDASNNAVASDKVVGPPRRLQWTGGPRYTRHHDKMTSMNAMVSAGGRVFYIFDEAPRVSVFLNPQWHLIARDAFNGTVLWKRMIEHWQSHLWPLKNGPAELPRRLVASGDRVYATLDIDGPVSALDAATGETLHTYDGTEGTEEIVLSDNILFAVIKEIDPSAAVRAQRRGQVWNEAGWKIAALDADTGKALWTKKESVLPTTLAIDKRHAVFHNGESVVCLDRTSGDERWRSEPVARSEQIRAFYSPTLVLYKDVVLFSGGETAGMQTGSWYRGGKDTMTALDAETGKVLWTAPHPPSGYRSAEDLLVVDGLVWTGETTSGRAEGLFTGRDPRTGEVKQEFTPDVSTYWFHHRCYRGKATDKFLLMSRAGVEFVDVENQSWSPNHFVRGACTYGIMPANGLLYAPQHPCACYPEAKLTGLNALAPAASSPPPPELSDSDRLQKGKAYNEIASRKSQIANPADWPTFRHDAARSGHASTSVPTKLHFVWKTKIGTKLSSPVIADGKVFVADVNAHTLHALDAASGERLWQFTAGGRIDSPPTWYRGGVYFGSADGHVYCLRAADGELAWRFLAATTDRRLVSFGQLESVWPVPGSVLVQDDVLYCVAGRSMFLDGGLRLWRLDPATGNVLSQSVLGDTEEGTGKNLQDFVSWLNMPTGLPDVLSSDGHFVYMRSQPFSLDGKRLPLTAPPRGRDADAGAPEAVQGREHAHVFSPTGFLDDSYWHRSYWIYGTMFVGGWQGYYRAGKNAPAGRILVHDEQTVYGFGRKPQYWKWTTPIEHHLFAAAKTGAASTDVEAASDGSRAPSEKSGSKQTPGFNVNYRWTTDLPIYALGFVLADETLFVAGPDDLIDEEQIQRRATAPETQALLVEQLAAWEGKKGAPLWAVSAISGEKLAELQLDTPPVFDGMAAAQGQLYVSGADGSVICLGAK